MISRTEAGVTEQGRRLDAIIANDNPDFSTLTDFEIRIWKATHRTPKRYSRRVQAL